MARKPAPETLPGDDVADLVETAEADGDQVAPETPEEAAFRIFDTDLTKRVVIAKLARIMADLPTLTPSGENKHFGYKFIKDTQVSGAIRPRMAREHLMLIHEVLDESIMEVPTRSGRSYLTRIRVRFTIIDADSGDSVSGTAVGYGDDAGDKGANKAITAAQKYFLLKIFQIGGEDDLESDNRADERAAERQAGGSGGTRDVRVEGASITGVERGGRSTTITTTQAKQILKLVGDLEWKPERFAEFVNALGGTQLDLPADGDPNPAIRAWLGKLTADQAGSLISLLANEKDKAAEPEDDGIPVDDEPSGSGYGS